MVRFMHWLSDVPPDHRRPYLEDVERIFGHYMRGSRMMLGWSQRELADHLEVEAGVKLDPSAITRIEAGARSVSLKQAFAISYVLDEMGLDVMLDEDAPSPQDLESWAATLREAIAKIEEEQRETEFKADLVRQRLEGHRKQLEAVELFAHEHGKSAAETLAQVQMESRRRARDESISVRPSVQ